MWKTAGEDITINMDVMVDDQFAKSDTGTVLVTLRDNQGLILPDWSRKVLPDPTGSVVSFVIPAAINTLPTGQIQTRYIRIEYKVNQRQYSHDLTYRLTDFLPLTSSPDGVRARVGATRTELPDSDIDIYGAYYSLSHAYNPMLLVALNSADISAVFANNAVEIKAALDVIPGLQQKILQSETQDNAEFTRMKMDMARLAALLESQLLTELNSITEISTGITTNTTFERFVLTAPVDVLTTALS